MNGLLADTIVLSSTRGAAEYQGEKLGEYLEAAEGYKGHPYYVQQDTEGNNKTFLYSEEGSWFVSGTLGHHYGELRSDQDTAKAPTAGWVYYDGEKDRDDDHSLYLSFDFLERCNLINVVMADNALRMQGLSEGLYRLGYISLVYTSWYPIREPQVHFFQLLVFMPLYIVLSIYSNTHLIDNIQGVFFNWYPP